MAKFHEFTNGNGFDGIRDSTDIGKFDQHNIPIQFIDDGANLTLGQMRFRNVFHRRHDIKQFHRILQSRST